MAQFFSIHPTHPQQRLVRRAGQLLRGGGLIAYPTDSCYALGCMQAATKAIERLRQVRDVDERHHLTLMCRDLSEVGAYAIVDDARFRLIKRVTPGSYTFILRATRSLPRRLVHPKRKTIGVRVPAHAVAHALLAEIDEPMLSSTLILPGDEQPLSDGAEIRERLEKELELVIDAGSCGTQPSTVIDLTGETPLVLRKGKGSLEPFVVEAV
ncbi:MAG TPA: L-threonylcarbamoyladenylate synthase [Burkholderiales bacterium]|jgi:tRNA threonylcarbamoyl adenosine modification protein (Sua5/YciO/YrdC/YwlC family)|nr:L-threonylcarbamoyladenylate synthase [Burkholderiales bacterium]